MYFFQLILSFTTIFAPFDHFSWNTGDHNIQVGSHYVEARKTIVLDLSSGAGVIDVREIKPLSPDIRLVKQPIVVEDSLTGVDLLKIDDNSFSYQFVADDLEHPVCNVHFSK